MFNIYVLGCTYSMFRVLAFLLLILFAFYVPKRLINLRNYSKLVPSRSVEKRYFIRFIANFIFAQRDERQFNGYPVMAMVLQYISAINHLFKNEMLHSIWIGVFSFINVTKPEAIEEVLSGTKMNEKGWFYEWLHCWLGTGLLTSHGQKWKSRRKLLTPSFHFDILKDFLPIINEKSMQLIRKLEKETTKDYVDITPFITLCSLDVICETTLGVNIHAQDNSDSDYIKTVARVTDGIVKRITNLASWSDRYFFLTSGKTFKKDLDLLHNFTKSVIQTKKQEMLANASKGIRIHKRKPLIEVLLEHHIETKDLSEEDIREEVDTFTFEGHDTTATAMTWSLYLIGLYKDVQDKVYEEIRDIFGDDDERPVTTEDLKDMKYLECVLKESLRLYPPVPIIARKADKDTTISGYPILKGAPIVISPFTLHRNDEIYPNPEVFDPNRFTPENSLKRHPFAYIPFAAGSRNCIGQRFAMMEDKVVVANILRKFSFTSLDERDKLLPSMEIVLRPSKPVRIMIRPRKINEYKTC